MVLLLQNVVNSHMNLLSKRVYGITLKKCRQLTYELAKKNNITAPVSWEKNKLAGKERFCSFIKKIQHTPEATTLARATAFSRYTVNEFFDKLASVMLAAKANEQIGSITSRERGELVTLACCISAIGNSISPAFIFPRIKYKNYFVCDRPTRSIGTSNKSGWINEKIFSMHLKHIVNQISCNNENRALLILDNQESNVSMASIQ